MGKVFGIILLVVAGFFFYMVSLLTFINEPSAAKKWGIVFGFSIPAVLPLFGGLALGGFRNWRRKTGIVLLSGAGATGLVVCAFVSICMDERYRGMVKPNTLRFFSDYSTGGAVTVALAVLGLLLILTRKRHADRTPRTSFGEDADGFGGGA